MPSRTAAFNDSTNSATFRFAHQMACVCQCLITALYLWSIVLICFSLLVTLTNVVKYTIVLVGKEANLTEEG